MTFSKFTFIAGCLAVSVFFAPANAASATGTEQANRIASTGATEIEALSRARFKALLDHDADFLKQHYTGDFQVVQADGRLVGIRFLEYLMKDEPKDANFEPFDYTIFVSQDQTQAVAYHKTHDTWDGQHTDAQYTEVYTKQGGQWRLRFEQVGEVHASSVPAAPTAPKR